MAKKKEVEVQLCQVKKRVIDFAIIGTTPLIFHCMSSKAKETLLAPSGRKTAADKASTLKHDPLQEYRDSVYSSVDPKSATFLQGLGVWFKRAICGAASDIPGVAKASMNRLVWVVGERVDIYGVPKLFITTVRSADQNRTPDMRTRAIVPEWCCRLSVEFPTPLVNDKQIADLLTAAGMIRGVGDFRAEKGAGNYGSFEPTTLDDPKFKSIMKLGGRKAQEQAIQAPDFYDDETEKYFNAFLSRVKDQGKEELVADLAGYKSLASWSRNGSTNGRKKKKLKKV